ncbi:MAG: hypothetical protein I3273_05920 [Candidatus Moeniiplasma glomeromycotorum]|nr:hypothetical protein [Candidatus Moeniiplasma glomeromycotorum]MCE8162312.1 hypothetical protein [Candidatus Moeniiplasma glomeromycotorum]MCE8163761.1 hypothetical protein [Candidatus Moeniiplasma glomeromycotorum]MCE8166236.1 hypothetical protein [Candidatus Moeniiplasma glomeromycotorum]MCE8166718.1 hypothetical protein [Candidatus Moeniiplasma glomeromycotorum]
MNDKKMVEVITLGTGRLWPHYNGKKALSANTLTKILREIEYGDIPAYILLQAAQRGKNFHDIVQTFIQTGKHPLFVDLKEVSNLGKLEQKVHETINFLKKKKPSELENFIGKEKLHYVFYKDELLATYVDLEFSDYIIELKSNSIKVKGIDTTNKSWEVLSTSLSPVGLLIFEVQLIIQALCTGKDIYLLWSTGQGVIYSRFELSDYSLKILDMLIDLVKNEEVYSLPVKKSIIQGIVNQYYPPKK